MRNWRSYCGRSCLTQPGWRTTLPWFTFSNGAVTMARKRKRKVNVSKAIRDYIKANPSVGPTEAAAAITKQVGKTVSPTYVSNVKSISKDKQPKNGRRGRKPGQSAVAVPAHKNGSVDMVTIAAMKELVGRVGADTAKQ